MLIKARVAKRPAQSFKQPLRAWLLV